MTIKEITTLRKSGKLSEALQAAETEYSQNINPYTVSALYWCLNDLYKTQTPEDATATVCRMKSMCDKYGTNDELMQKALRAAELHIVPHYQEVKDAVSKAKNGGDAVRLYQQIIRIYNDGQLDLSLYSDFGWLTYYALKHTLLNDAYNRKLMLNQYLKLDLPKPSVLHSLILSEAVKVEQNTPLQFRIRDFMRLWGLENIRDDDWLQYKTAEGNTLPSLVEKLIGVYAKELKTDGVEASEEFSELVDRALEKYPTSQNMPYFKATVLISQGKHDEAVKYYRDLILRFPAKYFLWHQTALLVDDVDTRIGLISKALTSGEDEQYLGSVRLAMARTLLAKGDLPHAMHELNRYRDYYQSRGWNLKPEYWTVYNQMNGVAAADDNNTLYAKYSPLVDDFIYGGLAEHIAVKVSEKTLSDKKHPGRKIYVWILRTKEDTFKLKKPAKFGLGRRLKDGTPFKVKVHKNNIVWINTLESLPDTDWIKEVSGRIKLRTDRNGSTFSMIGGVYISKTLLTTIVDGQSVRVLAVKQKNDKWAAVSLTKLM